MTDRRDEPPPPPAPCRFVTFVSARGGVGRSLAAFNVAGLLAGRGLRVLLLDLDLASPGITLLAEGAAARPGVVELLLGAVDEGREADLHRDDAAAVLARYAGPQPLPAGLRRAPEGSLHVVGAGLRGAGDRLRADRLAARMLAPEGPDRGWAEALRALVGRSGDFDYVVIDGGRGGAPAASLGLGLADQRVIVTGLGRQHLAGTLGLLTACRALGPDAGPPLVVLSPVPAGEDDHVEARLQATREALAAAWGAEVASDLQIPLHPQLAVDEGLQLLRGRGALFAAYRRIEGRVLAAAGDTVEAQVDAAIDAWKEGRGGAAAALLRRARLVSDGAPGWIDAFARHFVEGGAAAAGGAARPLFDLVLAHASGSALRQAARALSRAAQRRWDRGELPAAEAAFAAAVEADPTSAAALGTFANFLCDARRDLDRAEEMYRRALAAAGDDPLLLCNYATFLCDERRDLDGAEATYRRALAEDPEHALTLCNLATFLFEERGDAAAAAAMYERARDADPDDPGAVANLARLHLAGGQRGPGLDALAQALDLLDADAPREVDAECWMYAYCCDAPERREEALARLRALVVDHEVTTGAWDFGGVLRQAERTGHPEARWLPALADVLAGREPAASLDAWGAWAAAG